MGDWILCSDTSTTIPGNGRQSVRQLMTSPKKRMHSLKSQPLFLIESAVLIKKYKQVNIFGFYYIENFKRRCYGKVIDSFTG